MNVQELKAKALASRPDFVDFRAVEVDPSDILKLIAVVESALAMMDYGTRQDFPALDNALQELNA